VVGQKADPLTGSNNIYHFLFAIRNGKVAEVHEYIDTKYTDEVLGPLMQELAAG
jgi:hypothetical protein